MCASHATWSPATPPPSPIRDNEREVDSCLPTSTITHSPPISGVKRATPTTACAIESSKKPRFAEPKSNDEVKEPQEKAVPEKTKQNTFNQ